MGALVLLSSLVVTVAASAADLPTALHCRWLLESSLANRLVVGKLAAVPPGSAERIAVVAPVTPTELIELINVGVTRSGGAYPVHPNLDNPRFGDVDLDARDLALPDGAADRRAWSRSVQDLIVGRIRVTGRHPSVDADRFHDVMVRLTRGHRTTDERFSAAFDQIADAAAGTPSLPFVEPEVTDVNLGPYLQEVLNLGPDYHFLVGRQRTHAVARMLDIEWNDVGAPNSATRALFEGFFADLPSRAGFVLGLNEMAADRLRWPTRRTPTLSSIRLDEVVTVEPVGPGEDLFLRALADEPAL